MGSSACLVGACASVSLPAWAVWGMQRLLALSLLCGFSHPNIAAFWGTLREHTSLLLLWLRLHSPCPSRLDAAGTASTLLVPCLHTVCLSFPQRHSPDRTSARAEQGLGAREMQCGGTPVGLSPKLTLCLRW